MIKKSILLLSAAACIGNVALAQTQKCGTDEMLQKEMLKHPEIAKYQEQINKEYRQFMFQKQILSSITKIVAPYNPSKDSNYATLYIPVVVHVMHDYGTEYVSDDAIYSWIKDMNTVYNRTNTDLSSIVDEFKPYIGNAHLQFVLANKDPFGNASTGITRRQTYLTRGGDNQAKMDLWAPDRYLNIWLENFVGLGVSNGTVLAYATPPASGAANPYADGVIGRANNIINSLTGTKTYQHEVGHYLNLQHPWNSSNKGSGEACGDDEVDDTPPTVGHFGNGTATKPNGSGDCNKPYVLYDYDTACIGYRIPTVNITDPNFETFTDDSVFNAVTNSYYHYVSSPYWKSSNQALISLDSTLRPGTVKIIPGYIAIGQKTAVELISDSLRQPKGIVPGRIMNNFPYTSRPASLTGYWKYAPQNGDQGYARVTFYKGATVVKQVNYDLPGSVTSWTRFKIAIDPATFSDKPDNATIVFSASSDDTTKMRKGSALDVDDIALMDGDNGYFRTVNNGTTIDTADYPDIANTQNIMDYSDCPIMFTLQQVDRMRNALKSTVASRSNLVSKSNYFVTGIVDTATGLPIAKANLKPVPDFYIDKSAGVNADRQYFLCANDASKQFTFKNATWRSPATLNFSATDAATATGTSATYTTSINKPGWVNVTLTATSTTGGGDSTLVRNNYVYAADPEYIKDPMSGYFQEFNADGDVAKWPIFNYYNNDFKWELSNNTGFYDRSCIVYRGYDKRTGTAALTGAPAIHDAAGKLLTKDYDDFFTTGFNLSNIGDNCNLNFMYSGASRTSDNNIISDTLEIAYSNTCGSTFTTFAYLTKDQIFNKGAYGGQYAPLWLGDWALQSVNVPKAGRTEKVFFRFRYKPNSDVTRGDVGVSNDFYMDRINISPFALGLNTLLGKDKNIAIAPNPTSGNAYVVINGAEGTDANVIVTDITGKVVFRTTEKLNDKISRIEVPASAIAVKGLYMVQVIAGAYNYTDKLVSY